MRRPQGDLANISRNSSEEQLNIRVTEAQSIYLGEILSKYFLLSHVVVWILVLDKFCTMCQWTPWLLFQTMFFVVHSLSQCDTLENKNKHTSKFHKIFVSRRVRLILSSVLSTQCAQNAVYISDNNDCYCSVAHTSLHCPPWSAIYTYNVIWLIFVTIVLCDVLI